MLLVKYHFIYISSWRYNTEEKKTYSEKRGDMQLSHRLSNCLRLISAPVFLQIYVYNVLWSCFVVIYVQQRYICNVSALFPCLTYGTNDAKNCMHGIRSTFISGVSRWIKLHNSLSLAFIKKKVFILFAKNSPSQSPMHQPNFYILCPNIHNQKWIIIFPNEIFTKNSHKFK